MGLPLLHGGQEKLRLLGGRFRVAVCGRRFGKTFFAAREAVDLCEGASKSSRRVVWWISPILEQSRRVERELVYWLIEQRERTEGGRLKAEGRDEGSECGERESGGGRTEGGMQKAEGRGDGMECGERGSGGGETSCDFPLTPRDQTAGRVGPLPGGEKGLKWKYLKGERALVHLASGSRIEFHSAEQGDRLRGAGLHLAILDEAADIAESIWSSVVKPMLLETKGSALILGTPRGTSNWLHKLYRLGEERPGAPYGSARMPTRENPLVPVDDLEIFRIDMSEAEYRQEFEAEFIDGVNSVFKCVAECAGGAKREFGRPGFRYIHGIDLGQSKDFTAIASLAIREDNTGRNCVDGFARFNGEQWSVLCERIVEHVRRFPGPCVVDTTGVGRPIFEQLCGSIGYPMRAFLFSPDAKLDVVQGLAVAFENKRIIIPNERELIGELQSFQQTGWSATRRTPQYGAPSGLHDDCVIALGLAWWGLTRSGMATEGSGNPWREGWLYG